MKGIKTTLDTKVQPNFFYIDWKRTKTGWRNIGGYDKSVDAIVLNAAAEDKYPYKDINIWIPNPVAGDVYTISFDAWGSTANNNITTHMYGVTLKNIIAISEGGVRFDDNGRVDWHNLSEKSRRYFTTYKLPQNINYLMIRARLGTTYIRNIKLEKSPYPTDFEE